MSHQLLQRKKNSSKQVFALLIILLAVNSTTAISRKVTVTAEISVPISQRTVGLSYVGRFLEGKYIEELFVIEEKELAITQCNSKVSLLNISNPQAPFLCAEKIIEVIPEHIFYQDEPLFVTPYYRTAPDYFDFIIYNLSNPLEPKQLGGITLFRSSEFFAINSDNTLAVWPSHDYIYILDISNPCNISILATIIREEEYYTRQCLIYQDQYLIVRDENNFNTCDLRLFDVANPANPKELTFTIPEKFTTPTYFIPMEKNCLLIGGSSIFLLNLTKITKWEAIWERHETGFGKITRFKEPGYQDLVSIINERSLTIFNKTSLSFVGRKEEEYFGWTLCKKQYLQ